MAALFQNGPEYLARKEKPFKPHTVTLKQIHSGVPKHLLEKSTPYGLYMVFRHVAVMVLLHWFGTNIDPSIEKYLGDQSAQVQRAVRWSAFAFYYTFQSLSFAGTWALGHDAGHHSLVKSRWLNDAIGFALHTFDLVPYFAWRTTHHNHHKYTANIDRDETFLPSTREEWKLQPDGVATTIDYDEILGDLPIYSFTKLFVRQIIGFQVYLFTNRDGNRKYLPATNHWEPSSALFKRDEFWRIVAGTTATVGLWATLFYAGSLLGGWTMWKFYWVPWLIGNHWIFMVVFIQHADPTIPYYRGSQWNFQRGASSTIDRHALGWCGRFFLHNLAHDHMAHHFFSTVPSYNAPEVTKHLKGILGDAYNFDSTNTHYALWRDFTECRFVESAPGIVFWKNSKGEQQREIAPGVLDDEKSYQKEKERVLDMAVENFIPEL